MRNDVNIRNTKEGLMRLSLNRWMAVAAIAATGWMVGCAADSPTPTSGKGGGTTSSALALQLTTTNASPKAGSCTIVQAFATLSGAAVPDGTSIVLSTSFGIFAQNGLQTISLVSQSGAAAATVCSDSEGVVTVKGTVTLAGKTAQKTLILQFTSNGLPSGPFISICANPHSGPVTGGTTVTISGGGFGTVASNVRVFFRSGAVVHQGVVTNVTDSTITVTTPAFPELNGLGATSVDVQVVLGAGFVLDSPNCFTYTASAAFVSICANPGSGPLTGGTPVEIRGGGFGNDPTQVQVFFRIGSTTLPAVVTNVTDSDISVLTPAFPGLNPTVPNTADIIIKIGGLTTVTSLNCFTFTSVSLQPVVSSILPTSGTKLGGTRVTILGSGFSAPVQVFFGTVQAEVVSVNFSQIIAITPPLQANAAPGAVSVVVKNAACGTGVDCQSSGGVTYTYTVPLHITTFSPVQGDANTVVTILGEGFVAPLQVLFGSNEATVISVTGTQILVKPPPGCGAGGTITVTLIPTGESATSSASFTGVVPTLNATNPIVPNSGPANTVTHAVVNGEFFFGSTNPPVGIFNAQGGTVTITSTSQNNLGQFVFVDITPNGSASTVTFAIQNLSTFCISGTVTFTVTNAPQITVALNPNTGPVGTCTTATLSGTGFFPTGVPSDATIVNITGPGTPTVTIVTATESGGTQTLTLSICPTAAGAITFQIKNTGTGLTSSAITFTTTTSSASCAISASAPSPASGTAGSATPVTVTLTGTPSTITVCDPTGTTCGTSGVAVSGGTVSITGLSSSTLSLSITPTLSCTSGSVTFVVKNTLPSSAFCLSNTVTFNSTGTGAPTITSGPTPATIPSGGTTSGITISGTGFFNTGTASCTTNPSNVAITNVTAGFTVIVTCEAESAGTQTLTLTVSAPASCSAGSLSFNIANAATPTCTKTVSIATTGGVSVSAGPTPSGGLGGASTIATVTGTGFFRHTIPSDVNVCDPSGSPCGTLAPVAVTGGTVAIVGTSEDPDGTEHLSLSIIPNQCSPSVTFIIKNTFTGCTSSQLLFNNTSFVALAASFSQTPGAAGSGTIIFTSTATGGVAPYACLWTAAGGNGGPITILPSATTCNPVTVTWDCSTGGTPCITSPSIELRVTDTCTVVSDTGPVVVSPP
jgi:large repetitive protein